MYKLSEKVSISHVNPNPAIYSRPPPPKDSDRSLRIRTRFGLDFLSPTEYPWLRTRIGFDFLRPTEYPWLRTRIGLDFLRPTEYPWLRTRIDVHVSEYSNPPRRWSSTPHFKRIDILGSSQKSKGVVHHRVKVLKYMVHKWSIEYQNWIESEKLLLHSLHVTNFWKC